MIAGAPRASLSNSHPPVLHVQLPLLHTALMPQSELQRRSGSVPGVGAGVCDFVAYRTPPPKQAQHPAAAHLVQHAVSAIHAPLHTLKPVRGRSVRRSGQSSGWQGIALLPGGRGKGAADMHAETGVLAQPAEPRTGAAGHALVVLAERGSRWAVGVGVAADPGCAANLAGRAGVDALQVGLMRGEGGGR